MSDSRPPGDDWPPPPPVLPQTGDDILREVERLKGEPARVGCLGMSLRGLVILGVLAWLVWWLVTGRG